MSEQMTTPELLTITQLREAKGLSRPQLARALGVAYLSVRGWEMKHSRPAEYNLRKLTEFFDVPAESIDLAPFAEPGRRPYLQ